MNRLDELTKMKVDALMNLASINAKIEEQILHIESTLKIHIEDEKSQQVLIRPVIKIKGKGDMSEIVNKLNNDKLEKQVNNQITELKLLTDINKDLHATIAKLKAENKKFEDAFKGLMQFIDREKMSDIFTKFGEMLKNGGLDA